jgi:hypothetical protein
MNQYIQEQSILYLARLKQRGVIDADGSQPPQRRFHVRVRIVRWLQSALPQHAHDVHRQTKEI